MDQKGADYIIDETANQTQNLYDLKKTLQFLVPISIISILVSYFSAFHLIFHQLQIFSQALDRKCMFLICNGILAFLANNLKLNNSALNNGGGSSTKNFDDDGQDNHDLLVFQGNAASLEYAADHTQEEKEIKVQQVQDDGVSPINVAAEGISIERETVMLAEREEWWGEEEEEEDDEEEVEGVEKSSSVMSEMRVSTEELNKKFDEFIRRMKEEIRIEIVV